MIKRIAQRGADDCGIACLAMVTGLPYDDVADVLLPFVEARKGINDTHIKEFLWVRGFAWQDISRYVPVVPHDNVIAAKRDAWPPKPFAPSHICLVRATRDYHFTVMDDKGVTYDPWNAARASLTHSEYQEVLSVMGVWRVGALSDV